MNEQEFLDESLQFVKKMYFEFLEIRKISYEIFNIFNNICINNNIKYFVAFGTLLGQIRDGGMIPWDPDIDVCVPINTVQQLIYVLKNELPTDYFFESNFTHRNFPYYQMRIGKKGYSLDYIHVDIFYLIGAPEGKELEDFKNENKNLYKQRNYLFLSQQKLVNNKSKFYQIAKIIFYKILSKFATKHALDKKFKKLSNMYDYNSSKQLYVFCECGTDFDISDIEPIQIKNINDKNIGMPSNPFNILNKCYKDFKSYLPINQRFFEMLNWLKQYKIMVGDFKNLNYRG